jgi:hypothetical protein
MYPPINQLLLTILNTCFPANSVKSLSEEEQKQRRAFMKRVREAENPAQSTKLTINEILDFGIHNLDTVFGESKTLTYIRDRVSGFLSFYSKKFVFNTPTYFSADKTTSYLLRFYLPTVRDIALEMERLFGINTLLPSLEEHWYYPEKDQPTSVFSRVLQSWISHRYPSQSAAIRHASESSGKTFETTDTTIRRWIRGDNPPQSIFECLDTLCLSDEPDAIKLLFHYAIILVHYYRAVGKHTSISGSLFLIDSIGSWANQVLLLEKEAPPYLDLICKAIAFFLKETKSNNPEVKWKLASFVEKNGALVEEYNLKYKLETCWGRYYHHTEGDHQKALDHYLSAFSDGKYRAGRFQKQICVETLHCASQLEDRRTFKYVYSWMRLYEHFFSMPLDYEDMGIDQAIQYFKKAEYTLIYRIEGDEVILQP